MARIEDKRHVQIMRDLVAKFGGYKVNIVRPPNVFVGWHPGRIGIAIPDLIEIVEAERPDGLQMAIDFIEKRRDDFVSKVGVYDHTTNAIEMSDAAHETVGEWDEIIDALKELKK